MEIHIQIVFEPMEVLWIFTCVRHNDVIIYSIFNILILLIKKNNEITDIHPH